MSSLRFLHRIFCVSENTYVYVEKMDADVVATCPNNAQHICETGTAVIELVY